MTESGIRVVGFLDFSLVTGGFEEAAEWLVGEAALPRSAPLIVAHLNVNNYYRLRRDPRARERVREHYQLVFDGIGMKIGAWLLEGVWHPDLNGTDLFPLVMRKAAARSLKLFFLGGTVPVVEEMVARSLRTYPGVRIVGHHPGYFTEAEEERVVSLVQESGAQLLLLARGSEMHDGFLVRHRRVFEVSVIWNVGGLFNFVSGAVPRAPAPLRRLRMEWLFRFLLEPGRMWHRNLVVGPWFLAHVLRRRLGGREVSGAKP